ncbi:MAG: hypothetical protein KGM43_14555 [Planctomycetota bacterium]|nr:hypothetical protein [Planctomycetota bacterium]
MRKRNFKPSADGLQLEDRLVLSAVLPVLTIGTYNQVEKQIDHSFSKLLKNGNVPQLEASLTATSHRIPYGGQNLQPTWMADVSGISHYPDVAPAYQQVKADLTSYIQYGVSSGTFVVR